ncbi:hypothetical protein PVT68_10835 [Microbulbifer bruguierae]|uniref:Lipoprotein n=1 Tax=Microbulbifer bruguierae TaxID=3029061 RepID=A0ABY8N8P9_9GAMM|nr:hypothetical protein [Microbulbifer bruguierae]WGL15266.1 hypothetical protein PVT68_10835 [Microbulbifer bruguierae]
MHKFYKLFLIAGLSTTLAACTSHPVMNVYDRAVSERYDGTTQSAQTVAKAILTSCVDKGWVCRETEPGVIDASITVRKHRASARINYSAERYSIEYKDSYLLDYNDRRNTIHRNYNRWVNNLDHTIAKNLVR